MPSEENTVAIQTWCDDQRNKHKEATKLSEYQLSQLNTLTTWQKFLAENEESTQLNPVDSWQICFDLAMNEEKEK